MTEIPKNIDEAWGLFNSRRFEHGCDESMYNSFSTALAGLFANTPSPVDLPVWIKPLDWTKVALDSDQWNWLAVAKAETPFGTYSIDKNTEGFLRVRFGAQRVGHFETDQRAEAEACAQSDFETRIRAALSASEVEG